MVGTRSSRYASTISLWKLYLMTASIFPRDIWPHKASTGISIIIISRKTIPISLLRLTNLLLASRLSSVRNILNRLWWRRARMRIYTTSSHALAFSTTVSTFSTYSRWRSSPSHWIVHKSPCVYPSSEASTCATRTLLMSSGRLMVKTLRVSLKSRTLHSNSLRITTWPAHKTTSWSIVRW